MNFTIEVSSMTLLNFQAWDLWLEAKALDIVDSSLGQAYPAHEVSRCIQIGLLCVQEQVTDRPNMVEILFMLGNETTLPAPKKPAFINGKNINNGQDSSNFAEALGSINDVTIYVLEAHCMHILLMLQFRI